MKDFFVLRILDRLAFIFRWLKVDYKQMRSIIQLKLTLDSRRAPTIMSTSNSKKGNQDKNSFLMSLLLYFLTGLFLMSIIFLGNNILFQMSTIFGVVFFMVGLSLISDFSDVLLDLRDKSIIATKPVDSRTITMAKTIHILIYMSYITLALTVPTLIAGLFKYGIVFFLLYLLSLILIDLLIIVLTSLIYLLILRFFSGDKLKDIINYIQIALTLVFVLSYQFLGQLFRLSELEYVFEPAWWQYLLIPIWFAAPFEMLINFDYSFHLVVLSILALIVPFLAILIYQKLMPAFERYLEKLNTGSTIKYKKTGRIKTMLINILCRNKEERIIYEYTTRMIKTERKFKLKVYPSIGITLIFPYIFIINFVITFSEFKGLSNNTIFFLYFCMMSIPNIMIMLQHSDNYKAAWLFETLPIKNKSLIVKGTLKAAIVKLVFPIFILNSIIFSFLLAPEVILDILIIGVSILFYVVITYHLVGFKIPFSKSFEVQDANTAVAFLMLFIVGGFALGHLIFTLFNYGRYIYLGILILLSFLSWKFSFDNLDLKPNKQ